MRFFIRCLKPNVMVTLKLNSEDELERYSFHIALAAWEKQRVSVSARKITELKKTHQLASSYGPSSKSWKEFEKVYALSSSFASKEITDEILSTRGYHDRLLRRRREEKEERYSEIKREAGSEDITGAQHSHQCTIESSSDEQVGGRGGENRSWS